MKPKIKAINIRYFIYISVTSIILLFFSSCKTSPQFIDPVATQILADGVYVFNTERVLRDIDFEAMYAAYGISANQTVTKKSEGNAVLMQGDSFADPESGIKLSINIDGSITSPDNSTIQGRLDMNGSVMFSGLYEENGHTILISLKGVLIYQNRDSLAGNEFNGIYKAVDSGTGRNQVIMVNNGLYRWEYETPEEGDFLPWPIVVEADGTFNTGFEFTARSVMPGLGETFFSTVHSSEGKLGTGGNILIQNLTVTNGTSMVENQVPFTLEGVRVSTEDRKIFSENGIPEFSSGEKQSAYSIKSPKNVPGWYNEQLVSENGFYISCGSKSYDDRDTALRIAESIAAGKIISRIGLELSSSMETGSISSGDGVDGDRLYETISTLAAKGIPYTVTESFYDEGTGTAFVRVESAL